MERAKEYAFTLAPEFLLSMLIQLAGAASLDAQVALACFAADGRLHSLDRVILVGHSWVGLLELIVFVGAQSTEVVGCIVFWYLWKARHSKFPVQVLQVLSKPEFSHSGE